MPDLGDLFFKPGPAEVKLAKELERFSFGAATSPFAEVTPLEGPDNFVRTVVSLGGVTLDHAQDPETQQQNITVTGENVAQRIAGVHFVFDTVELLLLPGFGPPAPQEVTEDVATAVQTLNEGYEAQIS